MITYSSTWDAVVKIGAILLSACVGPALGGEHWFVWAGALPRTSGAISVGICMPLILILASHWIRMASSWLYARLSLGAYVTWVDAEQLCVLFQLDDKETWLPMKEVKLMPVLDRRAYLLRAAQTHAPARKIKVI